MHLISKPHCFSVMLQVLTAHMSFSFLIDHILNNLMLCSSRLAARRSRSNLQLRSHTHGHACIHMGTHRGHTQTHTERSPNSDRRSEVRTNQRPLPRFALPSRRISPPLHFSTSVAPLVSAPDPDPGTTAPTATRFRHPDPPPPSLHTPTTHNAFHMR